MSENVLLPDNFTFCSLIDVWDGDGRVDAVMSLDVATGVGTKVRRENGRMCFDRQTGEPESETFVAVSVRLRREAPESVRSDFYSYASRHAKTAKVRFES